ncbi:M48 family metallopeptidase [Demequina salsinemoris]|uniref:M48 family metallopeptidase n=1 Tax=Demequina salsinemoris TaxID=577470 RepID=UPI0007861BC1|nr:SprT-like domain-containing protein [Demequina salsinemoris]
MPPETTPYALVRRKGMKNLRIRVRPADGGVAVSAPHWVPKRTIDDFVAGRSEWIARERARLATLPPPLEAGPEAEALRAELRARVAPMLARWAERMDLLPVPPFIVRRMTTRWGTCNVRTRRITFALELARKDDEKLEYVVVHELAHLIEAGHGPRFHAVMDAHLPDWKRIRRKLNGR